MKVSDMSIMTSLSNSKICPFMILTERGDIVDCKNIFLWPKEKFIKKNYFSLSNDQQPIKHQEIKQVLSGDTYFTPISKHPLYGTHLWMQHDVSTLYNQKNILLTGVQIESGIEKKDLSQFILQALVDQFPYYVFWKNEYSQFMGCNRAFSSAVGLNSPKEIIGKSDHDLPWTDNESIKYRKDDVEIISSGIPRLLYEETQTSKKGNPINVLVNKMPLLDDNERIFGILGVYQDITEKKALEKTYHDGILCAERAKQNSAAQIRNMHHDIHACLPEMIAAIRALTTQNQEPAAEKEILGMLLKTCENLHTMYAQQSPALNTSDDDQLQSFSLTDMIEAIAALLMPKMRAKQLSFIYTIDNRIPKVIFSQQSSSIYRILFNILVHMIENTMKGNLNLQIKRMVKSGKFFLKIAFSSSNIDGSIELNSHPTNNHEIQDPSINTLDRTTCYRLQSVRDIINKSSENTLSIKNDQDGRVIFSCDVLI